MGAENPHGFCMGPDTGHWRCSPWLVNYMRDLRLDVYRGNEEGFRCCQHEIKAMVRLTMSRVRGRLLYIFERGRPPYEDTDMADYGSDPVLGRQLRMMLFRVYDDDGERGCGPLHYSFGLTGHTLLEEERP